MFKKDLLNTKKVDKRIPERKKSINNIEIRQITDFNEALNLLVFVNKNRSVMDTKMNSNSSRSHAIYTIYLEDCASKTIKFFKLFDLAGSEKPEGISKKSGVSVNLGLCGLNRLLLKLADGETVVYRGCELNKNLKGSFDVNCRTLFIACLNPNISNHRETLNTLNYASAATSIKLKNNNSIERVNYRKAKTFSETASSPFRFVSDGNILIDDKYKCIPVDAVFLSDTSACSSFYGESSDFSNETNDLSDISEDNDETDAFESELSGISSGSNQNTMKAESLTFLIEEN